jgi:hypothetical protein
MSTSPVTELALLLAAHDAEMVEGDLGDGFHCRVGRVYGRITLVFPTGQDPAARLDYARRAIEGLSTAQTGHYPWCERGRCRTKTASDGTTYTSHEGPRNALPGAAGDALLYSCLAAETDFPEPAVHVTFRGQGAPYTIPEAETLVADFEEFTAGLRRQIAQAQA